MPPSTAVKPSIATIKRFKAALFRWQNLRWLMPVIGVTTLLGTGRHPIALLNREPVEATPQFITYIYIDAGKQATPSRYDHDIPVQILEIKTDVLPSQRFTQDIKQTFLEPAIDDSPRCFQVTIHLLNAREETH